MTVVRQIGLTGHWEFRDSNGHVRNEPQGSDVWLGPNAGRTTTVEWFVKSGTYFCAILWEYTGTGWVDRGAPCVHIG